MRLVVSSVIVLVGFARQPRAIAWWRLLLAGALLGLTAIARSQFLLFIPFGLLVLIVAWAHGAPAGAALKRFAVVAGVGPAIDPVSARHLVASRPIPALTR